MKKRILVVDDNESMREIMRLQLSFLGSFEVYEAENGKNALDLFEALSPDLVFMDLLMPRMSGWQAIEAMRATEGGRRTPVVAWSCMSEEEAIYKRDWRSCGFDRFVHKGSMDRRSVEKILGQFGVSERGRTQ